MPTESLNIFTPERRLVEVLLPLPLHTTFTYALPQNCTDVVEPGYRVVVPFGKKKFYTGIVVGFPSTHHQDVEIKEVAMVLDASPILRHPQLKLWNWVADYYLCATGEVYKAAVPSGLKLESETFLEINPDYASDTELPTPTVLETEILQVLEHYGAMSLNALETKLSSPRGANKVVQHMVSEGVLIISEKLTERYRPRKIDCVNLSETITHVNEAFALAKGAPKQEQLLLAYMELSGIGRGRCDEVTKENLLARAGVSSPILLALIKKGVFSIYKKEVNRFKYSGTPTGKLPILSSAQAEALDAIHKSWLAKDVTLLHGVTSSGKTEIYIHLIDFVLRRGDQVLYLVPEIALTTQLTHRLQEVFGEKVVIYHSRFTDNERVDVWKKLLNSSEPVVVIGARSALFLPFKKLSLVIVDEEHESSYKQYDPAPRYNGRDVAIVLAGMHGAKTLLGSATPAIDTYYKAKESKFGLVSLTERYAGAMLPKIEIVGMQEAIRKKEVSGAFARRTVDSARDAIDRGSQVIFFQNRRGYAPLARCKQCAWVPKCDQCDVALTYHSHLRQLQCHYCGAVYPLPHVCPQCKEPSIEIIGYGTERIEEEVEKLFAGNKMLRMDLDTTRNKQAYSQIISDFSQSKASILIGTQMVTKGLDFAGVSMVGVLNADAIINYPDFRSAERAFNMLEQVAGRAGRRNDATGQVLIQTYQPQNAILQYVVNHDYQGFYNHEIEQRRNFCYPPFSRIIYIYIKHRDPAILRQVAEIYGQNLRTIFGQRVFGPEEPSVGRVQGLYIRKIMLKIETGAPMTQVKSLLRNCFLNMSRLPQMKGTIVYYDVDPQ